MKRLIFTCLFMLLTVSGCAFSHLKTRDDLEVDVPAEWTVSLYDNSDPMLSWWKDFEDSKLRTLIVELLEANYDLRIAAERVNQVRAEKRAESADLYPNLSGGFNAQRNRRSFLGFPIPGSEREVLSTTSNSFGFSLDLSWEIDLWGKLRSRRRAAVFRYEAEQALYRGARLSLIAQGIKSYLTALDLAKRTQARARLVELRRRILANVEARYRLGSQDTSQLNKAARDLGLSETLYAARLKDFDLAKRQLEVLLGRYPSAGLDLSADFPKITRSVPVGLPSQLLARRPDLMAAELKLLSQNEKLRESYALLYPQISLTASGGRSSNEIQDLLDGDFDVWNLVGNLTQPIFQGGRIVAGIDRQKSLLDQSLAEYANSVLKALAEVESSLAAESFLEQELKAAGESYDRARSLAQIDRKRYQQGVTDLVSSLESEIRSLETEIIYLEASRRRISNRVNLHLALGGDFEIDQEQNKRVEQS